MLENIQNLLEALNKEKEYHKKSKEDLLQFAKAHNLFSTEHHFLDTISNLDKSSLPIKKELIYIDPHSKEDLTYFYNFYTEEEQELYIKSYNENVRQLNREILITIKELLNFDNRYYVFFLENPVLKKLINTPFNKGLAVYVPTFEESIALSNVTNCQTAFMCHKPFRMVLFYEFAKKLSKLGLIFIICHEAQHSGRFHHKRMLNRKHNIWNIATDAIINKDLLTYTLPQFLRFNYNVKNKFHGKKIEDFILKLMETENKSLFLKTIEEFTEQQNNDFSFKENLDILYTKKIEKFNKEKKENFVYENEFNQAIKDYEALIQNYEETIKKINALTFINKEENALEELKLVGEIIDDLKEKIIHFFDNNQILTLFSTYLIEISALTEENLKANIKSFSLVGDKDKKSWRIFNKPTYSLAKLFSKENEEKLKKLSEEDIYSILAQELAQNNPPQSGNQSNNNNSDNDSHSNSGANSNGKNGSNGNSSNGNSSHSSNMNGEDNGNGGDDDNKHIQDGYEMNKNANNAQSRFDKKHNQQNAFKKTFGKSAEKMEKIFRDTLKDYGAPTTKEENAQAEQEAEETIKDFIREYQNNRFKYGNNGTIDKLDMIKRNEELEGKMNFRSTLQSLISKKTESGKWKKTQELTNFSRMTKHSAVQEFIGHKNQIKFYKKQQEKPVFKALVIFDTSGSVSLSMIKDYYLPEIKDLVLDHNFELHCISADTEIKSNSKFILNKNNFDDVDKNGFPFVGGGGTDMLSPLCYELTFAKEDYDLAIILSDGYYPAFTRTEFMEKIYGYYNDLINEAKSTHKKELLESIKHFKKCQRMLNNKPDFYFPNIFLLNTEERCFGSNGFEGFSRKELQEYILKSDKKINAKIEQINKPKGFQKSKENKRFRK